MFAFWNSHRITYICLISFKFELRILSTNRSHLNAQISVYPVKDRFSPIKHFITDVAATWDKFLTCQSARNGRLKTCPTSGPYAFGLQNVAYDSRGRFPLR